MGNQGRLLGRGVISAVTPMRGGGQAKFGRHLMPGDIAGPQRHDRLAQVDLASSGYNRSAVSGVSLSWEGMKILSPQQPVPFSASRDSRSRLVWSSVAGTVGSVWTRQPWWPSH